MDKCSDESDMEFTFVSYKSERLSDNSSGVKKASNLSMEVIFGSQV